MKLLIFCALITLMTTSCGDFLEEYSQNLAYTATVEDLDELLIGEGYMEAYSSTGTWDIRTFYYPWIHVMDDDITNFRTGGQFFYEGDNYASGSKLQGFHYWQPKPTVTYWGEFYDDDNWSRFYEHIAMLNALIYKANELRKEEPDKELDRVEGEALFLRAGYYFLLVNIYGKPYAKSTAYTDGGVPLKITEFVEDKYFSRDPVGVVYDQIVRDLQASMEYLRGVTQESVFRVSYEAACALLSRVYLYMEKYEESVAVADSIQRVSLQLKDLNTYNEGDDFAGKSSPEIIFSQGGYSIPLLFLDDSVNFIIRDYAITYQVSTDLLNAYDENDLRLKAFFSRSTTNKAVQCYKQKNISATEEVNGMISDNFLIRIAEVYLNKAEALAMLGREDEARSLIMELRAKRFAPENVPVITTTGEALVNEIRNERRLELCFEGHRWFDLRRYAVNSKYPMSKTIRHENYVLNSSNQWVVDGYYELKPYEQDMSAYLIPIPDEAIEFNNGALTNEVRPEREPQN